MERAETRADLERAAAEKYPHRSPMIDAGYAAEERSRQVLRAAYIQGRLDQAEKDAQIAEKYVPANPTQTWTGTRARIADRIRKEVQ